MRTGSEGIDPLKNSSITIKELSNGSDYNVWQIRHYIEEEKPYDNFSLKSSPDKYTQYVDKFIGMNAATVGYSSLGGDRMMYIGDGLLEIVYVTPDGSYVAPDDEDALKKYVVVAQSIEPNTEVKLTFEKDSDGNEYGSLIDTQTYDAITLTVRPVTDGPVISKKEAETEKAEEEKPAEEEQADSASASEGYEAIYNDYAEQLRNRTQSLLDEYRSESAGQSMDKKAEICNKKVEILATLSNEGVEKMADHMLHGGDSGEYTEWSGKLYDVYMEESQKIMTEYMNTAL